MTQSQTAVEKSENGKTRLALIKKDVVDVISRRIEELVGSGDLEMPENYSPQNALMAFWLTLQETKDKDDHPAIDVCTNNSIANAAMDMVIQGLTTSKKQGYLIVHGRKLTFMRSYFGTAAVLKRIEGAKGVDLDIATELVYEGDTFAYEVQGGKKCITEHIQKFENIDKDKIRGGYCLLIDAETGTVLHTEVMTIDQVRKAWEMGQAKGKGKLHENFTDEACKRTLINRACKVRINSSDDSYLKRAVQRQEVLAAENAMEAEMEEEANAKGLGLSVFEEDGGDDPAEIQDAERADGGRGGNLEDLIEEQEHILQQDPGF